MSRGRLTAPSSSVNGALLLSAPLYLAVAIPDAEHLDDFKRGLLQRHPGMNIIALDPTLGSPSNSPGNFRQISPLATDEQLRASLPGWNQFLHAHDSQAALTNGSGPYGVNCTIFYDTSLGSDLTTTITILPFEPVDFAAASFAREVSRSVKYIKIALLVMSQL